MSNAVLSGLAVVLALAFVGWPFFRTPDEEADGESLSPLERQKLEALTAIKEAEFDLRMGKLSQADFASLEQRYRRQALEAIAALEAAQPSPVAARAPRAGSSFAFCPDCGQKAGPGANFCAGCGRDLRRS